MLPPSLGTRDRQWRRSAQTLLDVAGTVLVACVAVATAATAVEAVGAIRPDAFAGSPVAVAVGGATAYGLLAAGPIMLVMAVLGLTSRRALLVCVAAALLALATLYSYDSYYLPTLRRPIDVGFWVGWPLCLTAASIVLVAIARRHPRLAAAGAGAVTWLALLDVIRMGIH